MVVDIIYKVKVTMEIDEKFKPLDCDDRYFCAHVNELSAIYDELYDNLDKKANKLLKGMLGAVDSRRIGVEWTSVQSLTTGNRLIDNE